MPDTGVYLDYANANAVVFYRDAAGIAVRRLSVPLGSGVKPDVQSAVNRVGADHVYTYSVSNAVSATQPVSRLVVNDPAVGKPVSLQALTGPVMPGGKGEFTVSDKRRPGLVRAIVRGETPEVALPADLPAAARADLIKLQRTSLSGNMTFVFGPRFATGATNAEIAADYLAGAERLAKLRQLDKNSPFVRDMLTALVAPDAAAAVAQLANKPQTAREMEFDRALRLALR